MAIPDRAAARALLDGLPDWLVLHSEGVARVGAAAARALAANGVAVDPELVEAAGRLHDIDKLETRSDGRRHGVVAAEQLTALGYGELAGPVAAHPLAALLDPARAPRTWAEICVSLADRRVALTFMSRDERIDDMVRRYPEHAAAIEDARSPARALENQVVSASGLSPTAFDAVLLQAWEDGDR